MLSKSERSTPKTKKSANTVTRSSCSQYNGSFQFQKRQNKPDKTLVLKMTTDFVRFLIQVDFLLDTDENLTLFL